MNIRPAHEVRSQAADGSVAGYIALATGRSFVPSERISSWRARTDGGLPRVDDAVPPPLPPPGARDSSGRSEEEGEVEAGEENSEPPVLAGKTPRLPGCLLLGSSSAPGPARRNMKRARRSGVGRSVTGMRCATYSTR